MSVQYDSSIDGRFLDYKKITLDLNNFRHRSGACNFRFAHRIEIGKIHNTDFESTLWKNTLAHNLLQEPSG